MAEQSVGSLGYATFAALILLLVLVLMLLLVLETLSVKILPTGSSPSARPNKDCA
jgi:hypothetical protein